MTSISGERDKMNCSKNEKRIVFKNIKPLNLALTLDCGQSFRWAENADGSWHGVAFEKGVDVFYENETLYIYGDVKEQDEALWLEYFDLDRDYAAICAKLCQDLWLNKAITAYPGIRILKQNPWEALCSFIISQNNNIPRIKGIINRLCAEFGTYLGQGDFSFPKAEVLAQKSAEDLTPLRAGFRVKYILDAAKKVANGEVDLQKIKALPLDQARIELQKIKGVGPKVAECALLYGFGKIEAFPVDVWVRKIMLELYSQGLPACTQGVEGIAQQYLFHWRRNIENPIK